jgi:hypothetical protein
MKQKPNSSTRRNRNESILRLPDLEHAKAAVLTASTRPTQSAARPSGAKKSTLMVLGRTIFPIIRTVIRASAVRHYNA